jgi:hypothetical protein
MALRAPTDTIEKLRQATWRLLVVVWMVGCERA